MQASSCLSASRTFHVSPTCVRRSEGPEGHVHLLKVEVKLLVYCSIFPSAVGLRASSEESCCSFTLTGTNARCHPGEALQACPTGIKTRSRLGETPQCPHKGAGGGCEAVLRPGMGGCKFAAVTRQSICKTRRSMLFMEAMNSSLRVHPSRLSSHALMTDRWEPHPAPPDVHIRDRTEPCRTESPSLLLLRLIRAEVSVTELQQEGERRTNSREMKPRLKQI